MKKLMLYVSILLTFFACSNDDEKSSLDEIREYLSASNISGVTESPYGIFYKDIQEGEGETGFDLPAQSATFTYKIYDLYTDELLGSSDVPVNYNLDEISYGIQLAILYMKAGGVSEFYIPSEYAMNTGNIRMEVDLLGLSEDYLTSDDKIQYYFKLNDITDIIADPSGVYIKHLEEGTGEVAGASIDQVTVTYVGSFMSNGVVFDQSASAVTFTLDKLIEGWQIGIPYMKKGGKAQLFVPSELGYDDGQERIFEITLEDFTLKE